MAKSTALVLTIALIPVLGVARQDRHRDDLETQVRGLLGQSGHRNEATRKHARARLDALVKQSYRRLFDLRQKTEDTRFKDQLSWLLSIPAIRSARLVISGKIVRIQQIQGGVVDYHKLLLHLDGAKELKPSAVKRERLDEDQVFELAWGTHLDTWLCSLMERDLSRVTGEHVFVLNRRELHYEHGHGPGTTFVYFEYEILPSAAVAVVPIVLAEK